MPDVLDLADLVFARGGGQTGYALYDGVVAPPAPDTPGAYATLYYTAGRAYATRLGGRPTTLRWGFSVVCSGPTRNTALGVVDRVRNRYTGWRPLDANGPQFVEVDAEAPLIRDDSVPNDIRFSLTLTYRLHTTRS